MRYYLVCLLTLLCAAAEAQHLDPSLNRDSLFKVLVKRQRPEIREQLLKLYDSTNIEEEDFLIDMLHLTYSSKQEMIANLDTNGANVDRLVTSFEKMLPRGYGLKIEFTPADTLYQTPASLTVAVGRPTPGPPGPHYWNLSRRSDSLRQVLRELRWTQASLDSLQSLLSAAHCVSIDNENMFGARDVRVGFSRSGMGMYLYDYYPVDLTPEEIKTLDPCNRIFYKGRIVLMYEVGAAGGRCFPDP